MKTTIALLLVVLAGSGGLAAHEPGSGRWIIPYKFTERDVGAVFIVNPDAQAKTAKVSRGYEGGCGFDALDTITVNARDAAIVPIRSPEGGFPAGCKRSWMEVESVDSRGLVPYATVRVQGQIMRIGAVPVHPVDAVDPSVPTPTGLFARHENRIEGDLESAGGKIVSTLFLSWDRVPPGWAPITHSSIVRIFKPDGGQLDPVATELNTATAEVFDQGDYRVCVRLVNRDGVEGPEACIGHRVDWGTLLPPAPIIVQLEVRGRVLQAWLRTVGDRGVNGVEVRYRVTDHGDLTTALPEITEADWPVARRMNLSSMEEGISGLGWWISAPRPARGRYRLAFRLTTRAGYRSAIANHPIVHVP